MKILLTFGLILLLAACSNITKNADGTVTTNYGFNLADVIDSVGKPDSVVVHLSVNGKAVDTLKFDSTKLSGTILKFPIVEPSNDQVTVEYQVWKGGQVVALNSQVYVSGETPTVPRPIINLPVVNPGADGSGFVGSPVSFGGSATIPYGSIVLMGWSFTGDTTQGKWDTTFSEPGSSFIYTYAEAGNYKAVFFAQGKNGIRTYGIRNMAITRNASTGVHVPQILSWTASDTTITIKDSVSFTLPAQGFTDANGPTDVKHFKWDLNGDGTYELDNASNAVVGFRYATAGTYTVKLKLVDSNGDTAVDSKTIHVLQGLPTVSAGSAVTDGNANAAIAFSGTALDPNAEGALNAAMGSIASYAWDYEGNGTWVTQASNSGFSHTYQDLKADSTYTAHFCATDDDGNTVCANRSVRIVNHAPVLASTAINASQNPVIINEPRVLRLNSADFTDPDANQVDSVTWSFSDGVASRTVGRNDTIQLVRATADTVTVTATVKDKYAQTGSRTLDIRIMPGFQDSRDGQWYATTTIGTQVWMASNLNYSGDNGAGARTYTKGWCYGVGGGSDTTQYQDSTSCGSGYGRLYTWADVMGFSNTFLTIQTTAGMITTPHRGICPTGWHVPTQAAWDSLAAFIRTDKSVASGNEGKYLKAVIAVDPKGWNSTSFNASDPYGFSALPAGYRNYDGIWVNRAEFAYFWSAGDYYSNYAWYRFLNYGIASLGANYLSKDYGFSARCLKD